MPVFLQLHVKVLEAWRKDPAALRRFGYLEDRT
jgi:GTPase Era involved in 16S rRNA processing